MPEQMSALPSISKNAKTNKHYDLSPEFFGNFLDPYMKYTSGLFYGEESLETGILQMLDKHISFLHQIERPRILEIGPGWGSFYRRLLAKKNCFDYLAINPSAAQNEFIHSQIDPHVRILETTFEKSDLGKETFDAIYFIGSFCHIADKPKSLAKARKYLRDNGRVVIEDTFFINRALYEAHAPRPETKFVQQDVFGYAQIQAFPDFIEMASGLGLQIKSLLEHSLSYKKTIDYWLCQLRDMNGADAIEFVKYLEIAQRGWQYTIANYLVELTWSES